jgi:hypothetical protein
MDPVRHSNDALNTERERERKHFARQKKKGEGLSLSLVDVGRRAQFTIAFTFYQPLVAHTHTYRPFQDCLVSALAKSRAASRLVRTMAGDSRNLQQTWLDF